MRTARHHEKFADSRVINSKDGTKITYYSLGSGPAVVVVPGALSTAEDYADYAKELAKHGFRVHVLDRRGHGKSGLQGDNYSIERECEDLEVVLSKTGAEYVVGHSFGGLVVLEEARHSPIIKRIALYEPGVSIDGSIPSNWFDEYEQKLGQNKPIEAFACFIRAMHPVFRYLPKWYFKLLMPIIFGDELKKIQNQLPANLYEHKEAVRLNNTYKNYSQVLAATLFMAGGKSRGAAKEAQQIAALMPDATVKIYPKFDHFGIDKRGPVEIADEVAKFFKG